ncbi:MAG TPA: pyruvate, phosphate dikinase [Nocardioides sp.]|nr:pyruvate, phosphate dikinase [Nocardioides sp.]
MSAATVAGVQPATVPLTGRTEHTREQVGGKAWSIQHMLALGIPVPPAFVLTTGVCDAYHRSGEVPPEVDAGIAAEMSRLEQEVGRTFGHGPHPLLVSVRSGAATSMPGMMDTVLNLGMDDAVEQALAAETGDSSYAADTRRRFVEQFEKIVGTTPPADPWEQLRLAVRAVLESWYSKRAVSYRAARGIPDTGGTAVTVQAMVFGNIDDRSGTGVLFTRDPLTGDPAPFGEWLPRGQGEDVVSGRFDALLLEELAAAQPEAHAELMGAAETLERAGRDVQDIEFTVQSGRLWLLQSRSAKRTPQAAVRTAVLLAEEGVITPAEALDRITPAALDTLLHPRLSPSAVAASPAVASGKPACPGIATGIVVTDADEAEDLADEGRDVILARPTTDPDDVAGMSVSVAVVTELGGATSHAAVVCRELAVPCVVGVGTGTVTALAGQVVTVDAAAGTVHLGRLPVDPALTADDPVLATLAQWLRAEPGAADAPTVVEMLEARIGRAVR